MSKVNWAAIIRENYDSILDNMRKFEKESYFYAGVIRVELNSDGTVDCGYDVDSNSYSTDVHNGHAIVLTRFDNSNVDLYDLTVDLTDDERLEQLVEYYGVTDAQAKAYLSAKEDDQVPDLMSAFPDAARDWFADIVDDVVNDAEFGMSECMLDEIVKEYA